MVSSYASSPSHRGLTWSRRRSVGRLSSFYNLTIFIRTTPTAVSTSCVSSSSTLLQLLTPSYSTCFCPPSPKLPTMRSPSESFDPFPVTFACWRRHLNLGPDEDNATSTTAREPPIPSLHQNHQRVITAITPTTTVPPQRVAHSAPALPLILTVDFYDERGGIVRIPRPYAVFLEGFHMFSKSVLSHLPIGNHFYLSLRARNLCGRLGWTMPCPSLPVPAHHSHLIVQSHLPSLSGSPIIGAHLIPIAEYRRLWALFGLLQHRLSIMGGGDRVTFSLWGVFLTLDGQVVYTTFKLTTTDANGRL